MNEVIAAVAASVTIASALIGAAVAYLRIYVSNAIFEAREAQNRSMREEFARRDLIAQQIQQQDIRIEDHDRRLILLETR